MKKKKYLPLYYKWMSDGQIPDYGLCLTLRERDIDDELLKLFNPPGPVGYWGYDGNPFPCGPTFYKELDKRGIARSEARHSFTQFRQTIVLFLAAMNDEL